MCYLIAVNLQPVGTIQPTLHSSSASKQYVGVCESEGDLPQRVQFIKSYLQFRHSLQFNKFRGDVTERSGTVHVK